MGSERPFVRIRGWRFWNSGGRFSANSGDDRMMDCSVSESFIERCRSKDKTMVRCSAKFHHDLQHVSGYSEPIGEEMSEWLAKRA